MLPCASHKPYSIAYTSAMFCSDLVSSRLLTFMSIFQQAWPLEEVRVRTVQYMLVTKWLERPTPFWTKNIACFLHANLLYMLFLRSFSPSQQLAIF